MVGALINGWRETIRASDDENHAGGSAIVGLLYVFGKLHGGEFFAMLVKQYYIVGGLEVLQDVL